MGYLIECFNKNCGGRAKADRITDLLKYHIKQFNSHAGWLYCQTCQSPAALLGRILNSKERGDTWNPIIRGVIKLGDLDKSGIVNDKRVLAKDREESYQPFVFLITYDNPINQIQGCWFCYYKDTRNAKNGRLKQGHGPGGSPVLGITQIANLMEQLGQINS